MPASHFMHRNATAVYMDFCHILQKSALPRMQTFKHVSLKNFNKTQIKRTMSHGALIISMTQSREVRLDIGCARLSFFHASQMTRVKAHVKALLVKGMTSKCANSSTCCWPTALHAVFMCFCQRLQEMVHSKTIPYNALQGYDATFDFLL
jgi:hypothetical protein